MKSSTILYVYALLPKMLDPLTPLGLASNVVQIVDFGVRTIAKAGELAATGTTKEDAHLEKLIQNNLSVHSDLQAARDDTIRQPKAV